MDIRIATIDDLDLVVNMFCRFGENSPYKNYVGKEQITNVMKNILEADNNEKIILLHGEVGMIIGIATPFLYGPHIVATELAWWVNPEARNSSVGKELLNAFEFWAKRVGCTLITMISLDDQLGNYYEKRGYSLFERAYMKEI